MYPINFPSQSYRPIILDVALSGVDATRFPHFPRESLFNPNRWLTWFTRNQHARTAGFLREKYIAESGTTLSLNFTLSDNNDWNNEIRDTELENNE